MARKTKTVTITDKGRDKEKTFLITEMSAAQAEAWAFRAFLALAKSGIDIPENIESMGMAGIASTGVQALSGLPWKDAEPLLKEMMDCVQIMPDPAKPAVMRALIDEDIEEIKTRLMLRKEVFGLHVDFFDTANPLLSKMPNTQVQPG